MFYRHALLLLGLLGLLVLGLCCCGSGGWRRRGLVMRLVVVVCMRIGVSWDICGGRRMLLGLLGPRESLGEVSTAHW